VKDKKGEKRKPPLADWVSVVQPAILSTKTGRQRFAITIKLPERSLKSASSFVKETNDALTKMAKLSGGGPAALFVLVDSERARLQRATADFFTFNGASACLDALAELGLQTTKVSAELEDFGTKRYDPWYESVSHAWWPWLAAWRNPPPEMPMAKVTNRLNLGEGSKYKEAATGKLGKSEEVDRSDARGEDRADDDADRTDEAPREDEDRPQKKSRRKKE
jgi:hypothetical protein